MGWNIGGDHSTTHYTFNHIDWTSDVFCSKFLSRIVFTFSSTQISLESENFGLLITPNTIPRTPLNIPQFKNKKSECTPLGKIMLQQKEVITSEET